MTSRPAVADGNVYFGSDDATFYAVDTESGAENWRFAAADSVNSPTIADSTAYVGSADGHLYALDASTGEQFWSYATEDWVFPAPAVAEGMVYFADDDSFVYAVTQ